MQMEFPFIDISMKRKDSKMSTYVVGDIHGCYEEFIDLVEKIEKQDASAHFILVGDIIDRGPDSIKMLRWAMDSCNKPDGKFELILGNHEYEKISLLERYFSFCEDGLANSMEEFCRQRQDDSYHFGRTLAEEHISDEEIKQYCRFFRLLPIYKELDVTIQGKRQHFIIVHGGLRIDFVNEDETFKKSTLSRKGLLFEARKDGHNTIEKIVWDRCSVALRRTIVIHGHTPTCDDPNIEGRIGFGQKEVNVDGGCVFRSKAYPNANLAALRLEDLEEFYRYDPGPITEVNKEKKDQLLKRKRRPSKKEREAKMKEAEQWLGLV